MFATFQILVNLTFLNINCICAQVVKRQFVFVFLIAYMSFVILYVCHVNWMTNRCPLLLFMNACSHVLDIYFGVIFIGPSKALCVTLTLRKTVHLWIPFLSFDIPNTKFLSILDFFHTPRSQSMYMSKKNPMCYPCEVCTYTSQHICYNLHNCDISHKLIQVVVVLCAKI